MGQELKRMKFKDAPIGARFKYPDSERIWVKINSYPKGPNNDGDGLICEWKGNNGEYQQFCRFSDEESGINFDTYVDLI